MGKWFHSVLSDHKSYSGSGGFTSRNTRCLQGRLLELGVHDGMGRTSTRPEQGEASRSDRILMSALDATIRLAALTHLLASASEHHRP